MHHTHYAYLLAKKRSGELAILLHEFGLPSHYVLWMEYYEFYLQHPEMSYREISYYFAATKSTIERAVSFMKAPLYEIVP